MSEETSKELGEAAGKIVNELYKDAAQPGVKQIGISLGSAIEWVVSPLVYKMQLANEKRRLIFSRNMESVRKFYATIPEQKAIEAAPEVSIPLLERLTYTSNEEIPVCLSIY